MRRRATVGDMRYGWAATLAMLLALGCSDEGGGKGWVDVGAAVQPLYGGAEVVYQAYSGDACDEGRAAQVSGPASAGSKQLWGAKAVFADQLLELEAGSYAICATVLDATGNVEARCPTAMAKAQVVAGGITELQIAVVCDPVIDRASGHAYTVTPWANSYLEAKAFAERMGGHLAIIESMEENLFLAHHFSPRKWIGFWDSDGDGLFEWIDGVPRSFTHWCLGEPNEHRGEHYAEWGFGGATNEYCWNNELHGVMQGIVELD